MTKTPVKFQKDWHKTVGGVAHTRYQIYIHFNSICASKMTKFKMQKKVTKINLRIISKSHAHLQNRKKTLVQFQKDCHITVGGVAHTRYLLLKGGQNNGKPNTMSPYFSSKRRGTIKVITVHPKFWQIIWKLNMCHQIVDFEQREEGVAGSILGSSNILSWRLVT